MEVYYTHKFNTQLLITVHNYYTTASSLFRSQNSTVSKALPYIYHTAVTIVMLLYCRNHSNVYCNKLIVTQHELLRYYRNATKT
jgi:hypothetical protein